MDPWWLRPRRLLACFRRLRQVVASSPIIRPLRMPPVRSRKLRGAPAALLPEMSHCQGASRFEDDAPRSRGIVAWRAFG